jgi:heme-degrading monooxygenase HmoA
MNHHLAQVNLAYSLAPQDDPLMADFVAQLDAVNALAEQSPGFVWRYKSADTRDPSQRELADPLVLFNMSVWESVEALHAFTYRSQHAKVFAARRKWFDEWKDRVRTVRELGEGMPGVALWWVPAGHIPTPQEGKQKLLVLGRKGPGPEAFTFRQMFTPAGLPIER